MSSIYRNAYITLVATTSPNGEVGCFTRPDQVMETAQRSVARVYNASTSATILNVDVDAAGADSTSVITSARLRIEANAIPGIVKYTECQGEERSRLELSLVGVPYPPTLESSQGVLFPDVPFWEDADPGMRDSTSVYIAVIASGKTERELSTFCLVLRGYTSKTLEEGYYERIALLKVPRSMSHQKRSLYWSFFQAINAAPRKIFTIV